MGREFESGPNIAIDTAEGRDAVTIQQPATPEVGQQTQDIQESIRFMHGIWPEMIHALLLEMKRSGKGFLDRRQAKKFLMSNADHVFEEAAARFQQLSPDIRAKAPDLLGVTERERIAFRLFESLLKANGFMTDVDMLSGRLSHEETSAVRDLVSPETYTQLEEKLQIEKDKIAFLDTPTSETEEG